MHEKPLAVAMSGGVDSSVVAGMLQARGENVIGLTMQLWNQRLLPEIQSDKATGRCCSLDDVYDARAVAQILGIPYYVVNFERDFEDQVVKPFVDEYLSGRTPVPCTLCNNFIKFDRFLEMAEGVGADRIATGHYAQIRWNPDNGRCTEEGRVELNPQEGLEIRPGLRHRIENEGEEDLEFILCSQPSTSGDRYTP